MKRGRRRVVVLGAAAGSAAVAAVLAVVFTPLVRSLAAWVSGADWAGMDGAARASAIGQLRLAVVQTAAALGGGIALLFTAFSYRLSRRGQVTDRFTTAIERLGSEETYVRLGGIFALEQIVQDAPEQAGHAAEILHAFIRDRARPAKKPDSLTVGPDLILQPPKRRKPRPGQPDPDVQQALAALLRRRTDPALPINLRDLHLAGADLARADLTKAALGRADMTLARLRDANLTGAALDSATLSRAQLLGADLTGALLPRAILTGARLKGAVLTGADLTQADLTRATMDNAKLTRASLIGADLTGAWLARADLTGTLLPGADLRDTRGLTLRQVVAAVLGADTKLPPALAEHPAVARRIQECAQQAKGAELVFRRRSRPPR